ncbi:MAG: GntR family transcriptional regulator, partial [Pseudonocardiaceae bacterium]
VPTEAIERAKRDPQSPYEKIAAELRRSILSGDLVYGDLAPTEKQLAAEHQVAIGTAHRAMELLKTWGFITSSRGRRATVVRPPEPVATPNAERPSDSGVLESAVREHSAPDVATLAETCTPLSGDCNHSSETATAAQLWAITLRGPDGRRYPARHVCEDLNLPAPFRANLLAIARIEEPRDTNGGDDWIGDYELEVRRPGKEHMDPVLTLRWQKS